MVEVFFGATISVAPLGAKPSRRIVPRVRLEKIVGFSRESTALGSII